MPWARAGPTGAQIGTRRSGGDDGAKLPSRQGRPDRPVQADHHALQRRGCRCARRRYRRLGAPRQRHPLRRPLVQVSPPARHLQPRHRGAERAAVGRPRRRPHRSQQSRHLPRGRQRPLASLAEPLAVARFRRRRRQRRAVADFRRRLLLQDVHVAAVLLEQGLRAGHPRRCGPWPRPCRTGSRPLSAHPRALRRADRRRRTGRHGGRAGGVRDRQARHARRRAGRDGRRAAARASPPPSTAGRHGSGSRMRWRGSPRATTSRCCRAPPPSATTITIIWAWCSVSPITWPFRRRTLPRERLWQVRAGEVVLATGAHERPLVFPGNDRPGIMLAESLRVFANRYGVVPGQRAVIVTSGASAYTAAADLEAAGDRGHGRRRASAQRLRGGGRRPARRRLRGAGRAHRARLARTQARQRPDRRAGRRTRQRRGSSHSAVRLRRSLRRLDAGRPPVLAVARQARLRCRSSMPSSRTTSVQAERSAGAARGTYPAVGVPRRRLARRCGRGGDRKRAPVHGQRRQDRLPAGARAAGGQRQGTRARLRRPAERRDGKGHRARSCAKASSSIEHVKRYTTTGMATDQGKTSSMNALGLVAESLGKPVPEVGTTTFRLPYTPVTFGALAGPNRAALFDPVRTTPTHDWAVAHGATFEDVGLWKRARCFPARGEDMHAAVDRECMAVRTRAGIFDASTLGKIEVVGPDAAEFLNRIYTNAFARLEPGRCRYGLMLKEDGYIFDDGVVARLARDRFHVTTTTGGAARVLQHMEDYLQTEWPGLEVYLTSITEQYAVIAVQGPKSREVLAPLVERHRPRRAGVSAHVGAHRHRLRGAVPAVPRLVHGRARLRDQRALRLRAAGVGGRDRARAGARHHALRHRGDARAARGEGLHRRRPGDRRHGDARRRGAGRAGRQVQAGLRRLPIAARGRISSRRGASSWSAY